ATPPLAQPLDLFRTEPSTSQPTGAIMGIRLVTRTRHFSRPVPSERKLCDACWRPVASTNGPRRFKNKVRDETAVDGPSLRTGRARVAGCLRLWSCVVAG